MLYHIILYDTILYYIELYSIILYYIILYYIILYYIILYYIILYYIILYYITLYYTILYYIICIYYYIILYYLYFIILFCLYMYIYMFYHIMATQSPNPRLRMLVCQLQRTWTFNQAFNGTTMRTTIGNLWSNVHNIAGSSRHGSIPFPETTPPRKDEEVALESSGAFTPPAAVRRVAGKNS